MPIVAVIATPPSYIASLGAVLDAHARLGEVFEQNPALGDYASMQTVLRLASPDGGDIVLVGGRAMAPDVRFAEIASPRIIFLPSFQITALDGLDDHLASFAAFHGWLRRQGESGVHIGACGASAFHLAAAGLLDGRSCAIGVRLIEPMRRLFPRVVLAEAKPLQREGNLWTCARDVDSAAMVAWLFAEAYSLHIGRGIAAREPPGPEAAALLEQTDPLVARAQSWIRERFTKRFRIADLAGDLGVSHQSLIRRFREAGSQTPRDYVQRVRVESAASMLAETRRSIAEIAQLVGYSDVASFRRIFSEAMGMSPGAYRRSSRGPAQPAAGAP